MLLWNMFVFFVIVFTACHCSSYNEQEDQGYRLSNMSWIPLSIRAPSWLQFSWENESHVILFGLVCTFLAVGCFPSWMTAKDIYAALLQHPVQLMGREGTERVCIILVPPSVNEGDNSVPCLINGKVSIWCGYKRRLNHYFLGTFRRMIHHCWTWLGGFWKETTLRKPPARCVTERSLPYQLWCIFTLFDNKEKKGAGWGWRKVK